MACSGWNSGVTSSARYRVAPFDAGISGEGHAVPDRRPVVDRKL